MIGIKSCGCLKAAAGPEAERGEREQPSVCHLLTFTRADAHRSLLQRANNHKRESLGGVLVSLIFSRKTIRFSEFSSGSDMYLVIWLLLFSVDPKENRLLCVVAFHLHHNVIFAGLPLTAAGSRTSHSYN